MNYAHIFNRVYRTPLLITEDGFRSVDAVLRPHLLGRATLPQPDARQVERAVNETASNGRKKRPRATTSTTYDSSGNAKTTVTDPRLYGLVGPGVASVPVVGILARNVSFLDELCLGLTGYEPIAAALQQAATADEVQEIILDVDSPGGECIGCFELAELIAGIEKPVYGFTEGLAASAAYCLISQCDEIYATQSTIRGSIGVLCGVLDDTAALAEEGYKIEYFTAGANKLHSGARGYTLSDSDRALTQERVDTYYGLFADAVASGREMDPAKIEPLAQKSAKVYVGQQAVAAGLADGIVSGFDELVAMIVAARSA